MSHSSPPEETSQKSPVESSDELTSITQRSDTTTCESTAEPLTPVSVDGKPLQFEEEIKIPKPQSGAGDTYSHPVEQSDTLVHNNEATKIRSDEEDQPAKKRTRTPSLKARESLEQIEATTNLGERDSCSSKITQVQEKAGISTEEDKKEGTEQLENKELQEPTPKEELEKEEKNKRPKLERKKHSREVEHLLYIAQWYANFGDGQDGTSGPGFEGNFGITSKRQTRNQRSNTYTDELARQFKIDNERRIQKREQQKIKMAEKMAEEEARREAERLEQLRIKEELKKKRDQEKKERAERAAELKRERALKVQAEPSPSPTPDSPSEEEEETVKDEIFVDGYKPFSYTLEKDVELPIPDNFFIPEVYSNQIDTIKNLKLTSAHKLITEDNRRHYRNLKNYDPKIIKFNNVLYPNVHENYYSVRAVSDLQLDPFDEMGKLMELLALNYFPDDEKLKIYNPSSPYSSLVGKYSHALEAADFESAIAILEEFNANVVRIQATNGFIEHLKQKKTISRVFVHEILNQVYSRSVSPNISKLKEYRAFSSNVYGELLPKFLSQVFDQVGMNSKSVFLDLGSGVGNVTIQAALEYGCESYGCEVMNNCSDLGDLQLKEFEERCRFFGLNPGKCKFFHRQSFIDNPEVKKVIDQADIILCNNFLFTPDLKGKTLKLFNSLKPGTKIISLKSILPDSHHIEFDDIENYVNKFEVCKYEFDTNSVSWTHKGGVFYISKFTGLISERALSVFNTRARERRLVINKKLSSE